VTGAVRAAGPPRTPCPQTGMTPYRAAHSQTARFSPEPLDSRLKHPGLG